MSDEVTLRMDTIAADRRTVIAASVADIVLERFQLPLVKSMIEQIERKLIDIWFERHAAEVLERLAPGAIADAIEDRIRAEIAKKVLGGLSEAIQVKAPR